MFKFLSILGGAVILVTIISWFAFPGWWAMTGGVWQLLGLAIGAVLLLAEKLISTYSKWKELEGKKEPLESPLQKITPDQIRERLGRGGNVNWIDRGAASVADLRIHRRVAISGRMKLGKTREAV